MSGVGVFSSRGDPRSSRWSAGEVGFLIGQHQGRSPTTKMGDTITDGENGPPPKPLPGFKEVKPMVFSGLYPAEPTQYGPAARRGREAASQRRLLHLRAGELGGAGLRLSLRLSGPAAHGDHQERLEREFDLDPDHHGSRPCDYRVTTTGGEVLVVDKPSQASRPAEHRHGRGALHPGHRSPARDGYLGGGAQALRGEARRAAGARSSSGRAACLLVYELPLNEIVLDFYDRLKSVCARATRRSTTSSSTCAPGDLVQARCPHQRRAGGCALADRSHASAPTCVGES